jgi:hypothetical protein
MDSQANNTVEIIEKERINHPRPSQIQTEHPVVYHTLLLHQKKDDHHGSTTERATYE